MNIEEDHPIRIQLGQCIYDLGQAFSKMYPDKSPEDFKSEIYQPLNALPSLDVQKMIEAIAAANSADTAKVGSIQVGCAFFIEADRHLRAGRIDHAWSKLVHARHWATIATLFSTVPQLQQELAKTIRTSTATAGGQARATRKFGEVKNEAFRLAEEEVKKAGRRLSRLQVATKIWRAVFDFAEKLKHPLSWENADRTVYKWLAEMPNASSLFERKPKSAKK